jgi:hypothetical protein
MAASALASSLDVFELIVINLRPLAKANLMKGGARPMVKTVFRIEVSRTALGDKPCRIAPVRR